MAGTCSSRDKTPKPGKSCGQAPPARYQCSGRKARACPSRAVSQYGGLIKIARCGFLWEKTMKRPISLVYTNCETAVAP